MKVIFKDASVYENGMMHKATLLFDGASLSLFSGEIFPLDAKVIPNTAIFPGFCDVHVHFREPGFSYKETVKTGALAAARGGYTAVMTMPNLKPAPDSVENLKVQLDAIERDACIDVYPYGTITVGEAGEVLSDMDGIAESVIGFSDDGRGVQSEDMMRAAMLKAKSLNKIIAAHCEDNSLLRGGYIHDGEYARANGHKGICSESEYGPIIRDLKIAGELGCKYHVCHVSAKESVEAIRRAKAEGVDVTCEVGPHYLTMNDLMLKDEGRFKMNPPIRSEEDRAALVAGLLDGTIDMIATDHAPHSAEEKSKGLSGSVMGVVGLECAFAILYTKLVLPGILSLTELVELMSIAPRKRFGLSGDPGFTVFELSEEYVVDPDEFLSMGKATPFEGWRVKGRCLATVLSGKAAYISEKLK